jgi:hypothetical protein
VRRGFDLVGAVLALAGGFFTPLNKYSWTGSPDLARIIDPDALLVATLMSVVAMVLAAVAIRPSRAGRIFPGAVLFLALVLFGRLVLIYILQFGVDLASVRRRVMPSAEALCCAVRRRLVPLGSWVVTSFKLAAGLASSAGATPTIRTALVPLPGATRWRGAPAGCCTNLVNQDFSR